VYTIFESNQAEGGAMTMAEGDCSYPLAVTRMKFNSRFLTHTFITHQWTSVRQWLDLD
jgi:hypothetical protein